MVTGKKHVFMLSFIISFISSVNIISPYYNTINFKVLLITNFVENSSKLHGFTYYFMKYIQRLLQKQLNEYLKIFPVTAITGPRQSGKSTFVKHNLKDKYKYVTFDDPLLIDFFHNDPKGFMEQYNNHVIFDEVQKVPEIFLLFKNGGG